VFFRSIVDADSGQFSSGTSLAALREAGLAQADGISREKSTAARFLYPKFGGMGSRWARDFEVAQRIAA
jgi:hypothetical protein